MRMVVVVNVFVGMTVKSLIFTMDMGVGVDVGVLVGVHKVAMFVLVVVDMGMLMGVLQRYCILDHQHGGNYHNGKTDVKLYGGPLSEYEHTKCHTKERRDGIVSAGFGCTQIFLRFDIKINAQTVCHKTKQKDSGDPEDPGYFLTNNQCHCQTSKAGKDPLDGGDLNG